jgi:hypothetical protein
VAKAGDTMTGPLVLPTGPTSALQAATKSYVDGRRLVDLADASLTDTPVEGDSLIYTSGRWDYRPIAGGSGGGPVVAEIPTAMDLDTYTTPGIYTQGATAGAAAGTHYPIALAGLLEVRASPDASHIWQTYTVYGRGGAVNTDIDSNVVWQRAKYLTTWDLWKPMAWGKNMVWNNEASGWKLPRTYAKFMSQDSGDEVYQDSVGKLRARPQYLADNAFTNTSAPNLYPVGTTMMGVSSAGGFPYAQSGNVITHARYQGDWVTQFFSCNAGDSKLVHRFGSGTTWGAWRLVTGNAYSETSPLVAYTGWAMNSSYMQVWGHVVQLYGSIKRTGAVLTSTGGDITNTNMCYIVAGLPYPITTQGFSFVAGGTLFGGQVGSDRVIVASCISRGSSIDTGDTLGFTCVYITNNGVDQ